MIISQHTYINWENYLEFGIRQFFKEKTGVYKQDTIGDGFYYVHKGLIKVITSTTKEKDRMLNIVVPGQLLGVQTMDQQVHFTTAVTVKDSILYYFPYEKFKELLRLQPTFLNLFTKTVIQKIHGLVELINLNSHSAESQIALILLNICYDFKDHEVHLTQKDLVTCTGLTRITVYKILKQWQKENLIEIQSRKLLIRDPDLLRNYVINS
ncbi:Crp/Fnr family transcriptional regulator [Peribacillus sp. TH16]|uniref:Crp/Fnr family transcriptional regulator n=1 Tax=unclassified Peribacillus TaxID=2675266 RepID=UPI0019137AD6|nr:MULTISPECIES: Crp/Fnr family transcriptional regulator [unclassified Peribacillus]MBK5458106.1 Crp/Fnr family transcriptional regulator [Peribacillus sp. TH27]MBK5482749.1 Crp/Fnr family transcriptional regulator [Peribacillus sp. TH16]